jgi:hypothetical protein
MVQNLGEATCCLIWVCIDNMISLKKNTVFICMLLPVFSNIRRFGSFEF